MGIGLLEEEITHQGRSATGPQQHAPSLMATSDLLPTTCQLHCAIAPCLGLLSPSLTFPASLACSGLSWPSLASSRPSFPGNSGAAANGARPGQGGTAAAAAAAWAFVRGGR